MPPPPRLEWALEDALSRAGCPVCALLRQDEERFWEGFLYERFQDPDAFAEMRASRGFCGRHTAQLTASRDVVPGATVALAALRGALDLLAARPARRRRWPGSSAAPAACLVCARLRRMQDLVLEELDRQLGRGGAAAERYAASAGVCVDHATAARSMGFRHGDALEAPTRQALEAAARAMQELLASFDYRERSAEPEMVEAWHRAVPLLRGDPGAIRVGLDD